MPMDKTNDNYLGRVPNHPYTHIRMGCRMSKYSMADLHNDVKYEGWGKTLMVCHRECIGILYPSR